jgi:hypothetical protein
MYKNARLVSAMSRRQMKPNSLRTFVVSIPSVTQRRRRANCTKVIRKLRSRSRDGLYRRQSPAEAGSVRTELKFEGKPQPTVLTEDGGYLNTEADERLAEGVWKAGDKVGQ